MKRMLHLLLTIPFSMFAAKSGYHDVIKDAGRYVSQQRQYFDPNCVQHTSKKSCHCYVEDLLEGNEDARGIYGEYILANLDDGLCYLMIDLASCNTRSKDLGEADNLPDFLFYLNPFQLEALKDMIRERAEQNIARDIAWMKEREAASLAVLATMQESSAILEIVEKSSAGSN